MKRYLISNDDYNYAFLHTNGSFYNCVIADIGCKLVMYKNLKSAKKKANDVRGYVIEVEMGKLLSEGVVIQ